MRSYPFLILYFFRASAYRCIRESTPLQVRNPLSVGKLPAALSLVRSSKDDDIFGAEFRLAQTTRQPSNKNAADRNDVMQGFRKLRSTVLADSLFFAAVGISIVWTFGTLTDVFSYSVGALLGICYSVLLGRYVERLGTARESKANDSLRFVPVVILVVLYSKFKDEFSLIMELAGFVVTYQAASFLQVFNANAYGDEQTVSDEVR